MTAPRPIWLGRHLSRSESAAAGRTPKRVVKVVGRNVHQLRSCVLAECAVDDDFSQGGLEDGEFVVV
jgi:hypothetical protein